MVRLPVHQSALSAPQNFIAEEASRRSSRHRWRIVSVALIVGAVGGGSWLAMTDEGRRLSGRDAAIPARLPDREMTLSERIERERDLLAQLRRLDGPPPSPPPSQTASQGALQEASLSLAAPPSGVLPRAETPPLATVPRPAEQAETTASIAGHPDRAGLRGGLRSATEASPQGENAIDKADLYLSRGQYTIARYLYEEAYRDGEILGALGMAKSYDAAHLKSLGLKNRGDPQKSRVWYRRASDLSLRGSRKTLDP